MKRSTIYIILILLSLNSYSQKNSSKNEVDEKEKEPPITHWNYGINMGVYFANKFPAGFYNGSPGNENTVNYVLRTDFWYQEIKKSLGISQSDTLYVPSYGYPTNMNYNVVMTGGVFIRYNFNKQLGLCFDVNYTKLKAEDAVLFVVPPPATVLEDTAKWLIPIQGVEQRVHFDILLQRNFWTKSRIYFLAQGGLNFNYAKVMKHSIYVNSSEYNLVDIYNGQQYVPNSYLQETPVLQGGVGYGIAFGGGIGIPLANQFGTEVGGMVNYNSVNLTGYKDFKFSYAVYIRFLFGNILPKPEED